MTRQKSKQTLTFEAVQAGLSGVKPNGDDSFMARCPAHDDKNPSLSVDRKGDGGALWHCKAGCSQEDVMRELLRPAGVSPKANGAPRSRIKVLPSAVWRATILADDTAGAAWLVGRGAWPEGRPLPERVRWLPKSAIEKFPQLGIPAQMAGALAYAYRAQEGKRSLRGLCLEGLLPGGKRPEKRVARTCGTKKGAWFDPSFGQAIGPDTVLVEGECDALAAFGFGIFPESTRVLCAGGSANLAASKLPECGAKHTVWPDGDDAGRKARDQLLAAHSRCEAYITPDGRDPADLIAAGDVQRQADLRIDPERPVLDAGAVPADAVRIPDTHADGFAAALEVIGVEYRHNTRSNRDEWRPANPKNPHPILGWEPEDDHHTDAVIAEMYRRCCMLNGKAEKPANFRAKRVWEHGLNAYVHAGRKVDPVVQWLETCLPEWDGEPRIDPLLGTVFDLADDTSEALAAWVGAYAFIGAITRAIRPGCKIDEVPVLIGPGGCGKSTFTRWLLPYGVEHEQRVWGLLHSDGLDLTSNAKEKLESTAGAWIVEISEMAGSTRAEASALKAYFSSCRDTARLAYRRNATDAWRRNIVIGTADHMEPLPHDHNLRRFVPIVLAGGSAHRVRTWLDEHRMQCWAEGIVRYKAGEPAWLKDELKAAQRDATERHRYKDPEFSEMVDDFLANIGEDTPFLMQTLMDHSEVPLARRGALFKGAARELKARGYESKLLRLGEKRGRFWARTAWRGT